MSFEDRFTNGDEFRAYITETFDIYPVTWTTGGLTGGNCWGGSANEPVEAEPEPELTVLDDILLDVFPSLTFMQFRVLMREDIVKVTTGTDSEYYGNYYRYSKKELDVDALYRALSGF